MATATPQVSLLMEFQSLHEMVTNGEPFTCQGITQRGVQCSRRIGPAAKGQLSKITFNVIEFLKKDRGGIKRLLCEASSLVMCTCRQNHQDQATDKCKAWIEMIPLSTDRLSLDDCDVKPTLPFSATSPSGDVAPTLSLSDEQQTEAGTTVDPESSSDHDFEDFEDSGYQSGDEQDSMNNSPAHPLSTIRASHSSASNEFATLSPKTPMTAHSQASTDSAISLTFDTFGERLTKQSTVDEVEPASPLASKAAKGKRVTADTQPSRPAATPVQPKPSESATKSDPRPINPTPRTFRPFKHSSENLIQYIKKPLGPEDLKDGYIYGFQVEGCALNKIGYVAQRKKENSLEAAFKKRMEEHQRCGWYDAKPVLKFPVPHAHRVEGIIHRHLVAGRRKEKDMCKGSNGRKCDHGTHEEWFEVPLNDIYTVVIAWSRWIKTNPYVKINGNLCLSPKWKESLDTVRIGSVGDHWLEWLNRYTATTTVIRAVVPETKYNSGPTDPDGKNDPFITTATAEITKKQRDGEIIHAPKDTEFPQNEFVFRLKHSKTWPRKI